MKKYSKIISCIIFIWAVLAAFSLGRYIEKQQHLQDRQRRREQLIVFAIDKAENKDLSDSGVMDALISNLYGAQEMCDDINIHMLINSLWNDLIFRPELYADKDVLIAQLQNILVMLKYN